MKPKLHSLFSNRALLYLVTFSMLIAVIFLAFSLLEEQQAKEHDHNAEDYRDKYIASNQEGWRLWHENDPVAENKLIEAAGYERSAFLEKVKSIKTSYMAMILRVSTQLAGFSVMAFLASFGLRDKARKTGCFIGIVFVCAAMGFSLAGLIDI